METSENYRSSMSTDFQLDLSLGFDWTIQNRHFDRLPCGFFGLSAALDVFFRLISDAKGVHLFREMHVSPAKVQHSYAAVGKH